MITIEQPDLFVVLEFAPEQWRERAVGIVEGLAASGRPFTADDLRAAGLPEPDTPNRVGALLSSMARRGVIRDVGYAKATRRSRHCGLVRVWEGT